MSAMNVASHNLFRYTAWFTITLAMAACSSSEDSRSDPPPFLNSPPALSGTPPTNAVQDLNYSFIPAGSDSDGDTLTFAITNLPSWASFDSSSGALRGRPSIQNLGTHADITISVSDGTESVAIPAFDIEVVQTGAGTVALGWMPPTLSADGSPLDDLASYRIRWGTQTGDHPNLQEVDNPGASSVVIDGLAPGNYFFVISAVDTSNNESQVSNEANGVVP